jgi:hypothetical protein
MKAICAQFVDIRLPVEPVFGFVADVARWPMWLAFVVSAQPSEPRSRGELVTNQEVDICMQRGRRRWHESFDVKRVVPNAVVQLEGSFSAARRLEFRFEQRRDMTRVRCAVGWPVFGGLLGTARDVLFVRHGMARELAHSMAYLKSFLEEAEHPEAANATVA